MGNTPKPTDFTTKLAHYRQLIDDDIETYAKHIESTTHDQYGAYAHSAVDAYLQILRRGGKRIRGALVMHGYAMSGGTDQAMILQAARAIEMIHAYILVVDDIQDRSMLRRGGPTAHVQLAASHTTNAFSGDGIHFGKSIAINGALTGLHAAEMILSHLDTDAELKLKVIGIVNRTMLVTLHGQSHDITNQVVDSVTQDDIERVMEWKTATYTFLNPLHVGMVLAGADCAATDAITPYASHTGKAFQITDDLVGTFGNTIDTHKDPMDDIREGKRTLLVVYVLEHATEADRTYLLQCLGNAKLTTTQFEHCKDILTKTGARDYAEKRAARHIEQAIASLDVEASRWSPDGVAFLRSLATYILERKT